MILFLPGFSSKNKLEMSNICSYLKLNGLKVFENEWRHWLGKDISWDPEIEVTLLKSKIMQENVDILIAKSLGIFVAAKILSAGIIKPKKIILMGLPLHDLNGPEKIFLKTILNTFKDKITLIHNDLDPHGAEKEIRSFLENNDYNIVIKEANNHQYDYPKEVFKLIS